MPELSYFKADHTKPSDFKSFFMSDVAAFLAVGAYHGKSTATLRRAPSHLTLSRHLFASAAPRR